MASRQEPPLPVVIVSPWDVFLATSTSPGQFGELWGDWLRLKYGGHVQDLMTVSELGIWLLPLQVLSNFLAESFSNKRTWSPRTLQLPPCQTDVIVIGSFVLGGWGNQNPIIIPRHSCKPTFAIMNPR